VCTTTWCEESVMNNHVFASPTGKYTTKNVCYRHKWLWYIFAAL